MNLSDEHKFNFSDLPFLEITYYVCTHVCTPALSEMKDLVKNTLHTYMNRNNNTLYQDAPY